MHHDVGDRPGRPRERAPRPRSRGRERSARDDSPRDAEREERDQALVGSHEAKLPRRRPGLLAHDPLDGRGVDVDLMRRRGLRERLEVRAHVLDLGTAARMARSTSSAMLVRLLELEVARELQVQRDLDAPVHVEHREVVDLANVGDAERGRERPLADAALAAARLHVDDDVDVGKAFAKGVLDPVRGSMPLANRRPGAMPMTTSAKWPPPA